MELCTSSSPSHLGDPCVRSSWSAIAPAFLVLVFLATSLPITVPARFRKYCRLLQTSFATYLPLHEAEALDLASVDSPPSLVNVVDVESPLLRSLLFVFAGLFESLVWVADASFYLILSPFDAWGAGRRLLVAFSWMYTAVRPITHPSATAPYDLFSIYVLHFIGGFLLLAGHVFEHTVSGTPLPSTMVLFGLSVNLAVIVTLLYVTVKMPIGLPSTFVRKEDIGYSVAPEDYTSLFGWITFSWVYSLIQRGTNTTLEEKDVWTLSPTNQSRPLFTKFQNLRGASLLRRLWAANSLDILLDFFGTLGSVIFQYAGPFFLKRLLDSIDRPDRTSKDKGIAYNYAGLMFLCSVVKRAATRIRSELMAAIYDKTLKRKDFSGIIHKEKVQQATASGPSRGNNPKTKAKAEDNVPSAGADTGKIVNLMSGDAERIATITNSMYFVYGAPLEFTIGFMFLYQLLGWSAFSGFIAIVAGWPLNNYLAERNSRINKGILKAKDKRMGEVNELLGAIKFVKFFSWEEMWIGRAMHARDEEMAWRLKVCWSITPILLSIISFFTYVALGNKLTIAKAFTVCPILTDTFQARIAVDRIAVFLGEAEVTDQVSSLKKDFSEPELPGSEDDALGLENASFKWNDVEVVDEEHDSTVDADSTSSYSDRRFELKDVSVLFPEGALTVVTGPTARLLNMGVLGEMTILNGRIIMSKNPSSIDEWGNMRAISYVAQDNITFGYPWDEERYRDVIECCALKPDLEMLEDGDATEIGAKGVSLSGGQKARVALARACYARTKWVLLDDPLSAVDSHTARFLYDSVISGAQYLVRMKDGRIDSQGTVDELRSQGVLEDIEHEAAAEVKEEEPIVASETAIEAENVDEGAKEAKKPRKLVEDEHRETGSVKWSVYKAYLAASGYWIWGIFIALVFVLQLKSVGEKIWIKIWGEAYEAKISASAAYIYSSFGVAATSDITGNGDMLDTLVQPVHALGSWPPAVERPFFYAGIYAAIGFFGVAVHILSVAMEHTGALNASRNLYRRLLVSVVRATFRFGRDIEIVDNQIAWWAQIYLTTLHCSPATCRSVFPLFIIPASIIGYLYRTLALGYLYTGRDLRRMESNSRSPIFSDFAALLDGIVTVRAFSAEKRLLNKLHERLDASTKLWYAFWMTNRWLLLNFDFLGSSALNFSQGVYLTLRFWTTLELDLNCVERIVEYLNLPQEPPATIESRRPPAYWPSSSKSDALVRVENVVVKYAPDLPPVLRGISFSLKASERVGLVDPSSGKIIIDGVDISKIGLHGERRRPTFIPQDATLFSGTLRDNLDPFGEYDDDVCMNVLHRVQLINQSQNASRDITPYNTRPPSIVADDSVFTAVTDIEAKPVISLDTQVSAAGANFSQGQRQLIALARALLRRSAIVILDEATSSVDFETDAKIQATIRDEFAGSLLLTVAHRLRTIMDYDRLIVLDQGKVAEFDTPLRLMNKEDGIFRRMCLRSGSFEQLEAMARAKEDGVS
ncbi:hypothetical protein B0H10DRAFT_2169170 [Mycena sp. CBHHK59/15]|nr:hypothetical protein B0H10DRAFT_2169170 [Mycena sp. CBHHK59/15]